MPLCLWIKITKIPKTTRNTTVNMTEPIRIHQNNPRI
jgi:hypothetical protein